MALVLYRRTRERIVIEAGADRIYVCVSEIKSASAVLIAVEAPQHVRIDREELIDAGIQNQRDATRGRKDGQATGRLRAAPEASGGSHRTVKRDGERGGPVQPR